MGEILSAQLEPAVVMVEASKSRRATFLPEATKTPARPRDHDANKDKERVWRSLQDAAVARRDQPSIEGRSPAHAAHAALCFLRSNFFL
ncbi:MAG: hypothetical protein ACLQE9_20715, partial [Roseiarcus sp.]